MIKVGDKVRDRHDGRAGFVTEVSVWPGTPSDENHGTIEVRYIQPDRFAGLIEHYVHYGWEEHLSIG
jgi:hypothetical protein